jgi:L-iditol 2-dehydrogenase
LRVCVYYSNSDVRVEEVPVPEISAGELLVRIEASGICGSDVMEWYRKKKAPLVLGHEIAGEILVVGEGVSPDLKEGTRIVATHHVPCGECKYCKAGHHSVCDTLRTTRFDPGGFSEYVRLPKINVEKGTLVLPDELSYEEGTFVEPLGCVVRGFRHCGFQPGRSVLVLGSGISGCLNIRMAKALGASIILATDIHQYRQDFALVSGANAVFDASDDVPALVKEANDGLPVDLVIV